MRRSNLWELMNEYKNGVNGYARACVRGCVYSYVFICIYMYLYVFICIYMYLYVFICIYMYLYVFICIYMYLYVFICIYMYLYVFICIMKDRLFTRILFCVSLDF